MLLGSAGAIVLGPLLLIHYVALFYLGWLIVLKKDYFWKSLSGLLTVIIWSHITSYVSFKNETSMIVLVSLPYVFILLLLLYQKPERSKGAAEDENEIESNE